MRDQLAPKLDAYLLSVQGKPLDYKAFDCVRWVGGWHQLATGVDALAGLGWSSLEEGQALLEHFGAKDLAAAVSLKLRPIPVARAMLGDILAMAPPAGSVWNPMGLCAGLGAFFLFNKTPLMRTRTMKAAYAWSLD